MRVLTELLPGADAPSIFHKKPSVALLCMDRHELETLVALREGARLVPPLDVAATSTKIHPSFRKTPNASKRACLPPSTR